jgi:DNA-binding NarL/FixJ family response regulator
MQARIEVLLVEDEVIVRSAIAALLVQQEKLAVVGEVTTAEAVSKAEQLQPDVVLIDLELPDERGAQIIREILAKVPQTRIVIFSAVANAHARATAFVTGASGYVCKTQSISELVQAILDICAKQQATQSATNRARAQATFSSVTGFPSNMLSEAEMRVLVLLAQGLTNRAIGLQLGIKIKTVECHVSRIFNKLQINNRTQAALYLLKDSCLTEEQDSPPAPGLAGKTMTRAVRERPQPAHRLSS